MYYDVILSGFGGQGILLIGDILAQAAMMEDKHVTWMPAYGVEMRGGAANCTVVISSETIGSPITDEPQGLICMSKPSLLKFQEKIKKDGLLIVNTSFVEEGLVTRKDLERICLPASELAFQEVGQHKMANMIVFGAFLAASGVVSPQTVEAALTELFQGEKEKHIPPMIQAMKCGMNYKDKQEV